MKGIQSHRENKTIIITAIINPCYSSWLNIERVKNKGNITNVIPDINLRFLHSRKRWFADTCRYINTIRTNILHIILLKIKSINNGTR